MPKIIKIGKSSDNDFVINNPTVSRSHAMLTVADDNQHATLRDLGSTNGTYVNGIRINTDTPINLTSQLRFGSETTTLSVILSRARPRQPVRPLDPNSRLVGRGDACQIRLPYDDVSARHAILTKRPDGSIYIEDCGSRNGTFVNGERIMSRVLNRGDRVTITRNHSLDWESVFPQVAVQGHGGNGKSSNTKTIVAIAAAVIVVVCLGIGGAYWFSHRTWDRERIYDTYNTAVCWITAQYGYKIFLDEEDITSDICSILKITPSDEVHVNEQGSLESGPTVIQGTAFFVSDDGKLATNLHVVRPWMYDNNGDAIENAVNKIVAILATQDPRLSRSKVEVQGVMNAMYIIPNGLPISEGNAVKCDEIKVYDDINKDVAIIQTESRTLPSAVKHIVDVNNADLDESSIKEGKPVFAIGFPYGDQIALNSNQELKNQVHGGAITQNRGDFEFGHDIETASGASGSPVFNGRGQLIGIHHAGMTGLTGAQGFNMAIKAKYIIDLLK